MSSFDLKSRMFLRELADSVVDCDKGLKRAFIAFLDCAWPKEEWLGKSYRGKTPETSIDRMKLVKFERKLPLLGIIQRW